MADVATQLSEETDSEQMIDNTQSVTPHLPELIVKRRINAYRRWDALSPAERKQLALERMKNMRRALYGNLIEKKKVGRPQVPKYLKTLNQLR